jgi:[NiFe] hydrogenase assembly HybE family chaperone
MNAAFEGSYLGDGTRIDDDARLECGVCWHVYDPAVGDDVAQVPPGTPFAKLPDGWHCPNCDAEKHRFMVIGSAMTDTRDPGGAVDRLVNAYRRASINMKGLPIYNPALIVEALGFREHAGRLCGVVVTPWFMNLTVLPAAADAEAWRLGDTVRLAFPFGEYDFMLSELEGVGLIGTCSLFSPMNDFTDHEAARIAGEAIGRGLFEPDEAQQPAAAAEPAAPQPISRRALLGV